MDISIPEACSFQTEMVVTHADTAAHYGSGLVEVFATPAMIALMENTAMKALLPFLPEGYNSVGTEVNIKHYRATPAGKRVNCDARVISQEGKKVIFEVEAADDKGRIGSGTHTRYIIHTESFMAGLAT